MKSTCSKIKNENWKEIEKDKSGLVSLEKKHTEESLNYRVYIKETTPRELVKETKKEITRKLKKEYFQNPEFKIMMTLWVFLLPQFSLIPYLNYIYNLLPHEKELKKKIIKIDLIEKISGIVDELKEESFNFLLFNYLETYPPKLNLLSGKMDKSHYLFNTIFLGVNIQLYTNF